MQVVSLCSWRIHIAEYRLECHTMELLLCLDGFNIAGDAYKHR